MFTHATWWKNLNNGTPVTVRVRGREVQGLAEPVAADKHAVAAGLMEHLRVVPSDASFYGVAGRRNPKVEELERAAQTVVMLRIRPC